MRRKSRRDPAREWLEPFLAAGKATTPACPLVGDCGGCNLQALPYEDQLELKAGIVRARLDEQGLGSLAPTTVEGSPLRFGYRNHMEFSFAARRWLTRGELQSGLSFDRSFALGLHVRGGFDRVVQAESCVLQPPVGDRILRAVAGFARSSGEAAYDPRNHTGFWRWLIVRTADNGKRAGVCLVSTRRDAGMMKELGTELSRACPEVTSFSNGVTARVADSSEGAEVFIDGGDTHLVEQVGPFRYRIAPMAFFQPNSLAAERIGREVERSVAESGADRGLDLFCGSGLLTFFAARHLRGVQGLEFSRASVLAAEENARANGIEGVEFAIADLSRGVDAARLEGRDLVIADPPRSGLSEALARQLVEAGPRRLIYVSCEPRSLARDLTIFLGAGRYALERLSAIDQFPHTAHVECIAVLDRAH